MSDMSGAIATDIQELLGSGTMGTRAQGEMSPLELLAQTIDRSVYAGVQDGANAISGADIEGWAAAIADAGDQGSQAQWGMAEQIRGDILAYRVGKKDFDAAFGGGFDQATAAASGNQSSGGYDAEGNFVRNPFSNVEGDDWQGGASVRGAGLQAFDVNSGLSGDIAQNFETYGYDHPTAFGYSPQGGEGPMPGSTKKPGDDAPTIEPGSLKVIESTLRRWGFDVGEIAGLAGWVQAQLQAGVPVESVLILIYDQPDFQKRFPGMAASKEGGYTPLSPGDYIEYEDSLREYVDKWLPGEMVGNLDQLVATLMGGNISLQQVNERLQIAYDEILNAPVDVKSWFTDQYGNDGDANLASILLDPNSSFTDLEQNAKEAYTQAAASEILATNITEETARKIVNLGYTQESQYRQFTNLTQQEHLFAEKLGEGVDMTMVDEGVEAAFGLDADSQEAVTKRKETRSATAKGGGGAYVRGTKTGVGAANA